MSEGTAPLEPSAAGSTWFSRHPRLRTAARTFAAAWCGIFVAAAAAILTTPTEADCAVIRAFFFFVLAVFLLIVAVGICRWGDRLPRYGFVVGNIITLWLVPVEWRLWASLAAAPPLMLWLFFGCRWRGARRAAALGVIMVAAFFDLKPRYDVSLPEAAYLPISLLADRERVHIFAVGEDVQKDWWERTGYVKVSAEGSVDVAIAGGGVSSPVLSCFDVYGMISRGDWYRRGIYRHLTGRLAPDGVLVLPVRELRLLPEGDWRFAPLPGAPDEWLAARRGQSPVTDPEKLDARLQKFQERLPESWFLLPEGAFAAMYYAPQLKPVYFETQPERRLPFGAWQWWFFGGALLFFCVRMLLCRSEKGSTAVAALENALTLTLFTLGLARSVAEAEFVTGIPPQLLFCGSGIFLLPLRPGKRGAVLLNLAGVAALLPALFFSGNATVLWGCWAAAAFSAAVLRERLCGESSRLVWLWSFLGALAGGAVYALLLIFNADTLTAVAAICVVFRGGALCRHWRE